MYTRRRLELEQLGERILPSATLLSLPAIITPPALGAVQDHPLAGQGHGSYAGASMVADTGVHYALHGMADLAAMGRVSVTGAVNGVGFIWQGRAAGTLVFANALGSATVSLQGPVQSGFAPLPQQFSYTVIAGTGAYRHLDDHGSLRLVLQTGPSAASPHTFFPTSQGSFTLSMNPKAGSGIEGIAWVGPVTPVSMPGTPNIRPLAGAVISVQTIDSGTEVACVTADQNGRFLIALAPGRYRIVPLPPVPGEILPRGTPLTVVVAAGDYTFVPVNYDSGIR